MTSFSSHSDLIRTFIAIAIFLHKPGVSHCAKILFFQILATPSHNMIMHPLATELAEKGHEVTYLSSIKVKFEQHNINYFYPQTVSEYMQQTLSAIGDERREDYSPRAYVGVTSLGVRLCSLFMESPEVHDWIEDSTFDLLVINACYNECGLSLGYKFGAPHVIVQTSAFTSWQADIYGIPSEASSIPDLRLNVKQNMSFMEKVYSTMFSLEMYLYDLRWKYFQEIDEIVKKGLRDNALPDTNTLLNDVRLVLVNSYFASEYGHSFPPMVIPVGGLHCATPNDTLPQNIANFIEKFDGFVYVSFGTMSKLSYEMEVGLVEDLPKLFPKIGFLVKWTSELPDQYPANILPLSWTPQQLLLAHPKIRGFITHAGMLSVQEASFYGVPVIVMPTRIDQDYNAECLVRLGVGIKLELNEVTAEKLAAAVHEILYNKAYKEKMRGLSAVYRDRPMSALETAVWWLEFVIRNDADGNNLSNMKSPGMEQTWWQVRLLDVWGFLFFCLLIVALSIFKAVILIRELVCTWSLFSAGNGKRRKNLKAKAKSS